MNLRNTRRMLALIAGAAFVTTSAVGLSQSEIQTGVPDPEITVTSPDAQVTEEITVETPGNITTTVEETTPTETIRIYEQTTSPNPEVWRDRYNALIINAPDGKENLNDLYQQQKGNVEMGEGKLQPYDLIVVELISAGTPETNASQINRQSISWDAAERLQQRFFPTQTELFQVVLMTKTGEIIMREMNPVEMEDVYASLDEFIANPDAPVLDEGERERTELPLTPKGEGAAEVDTAEEAQVPPPVTVQPQPGVPSP